MMLVTINSVESIGIMFNVTGTVLIRESNSRRLYLGIHIYPRSSLEARRV